MHNKKKLFLLFVFFNSCVDLKSYYYMNSEPISFRSILTGNNCTSVDYNILNAGDGSIGGFKRLFGVHEMSITIPGYEPVYLVQEDVCFYPNLFTMLWFLGKNNPIVQRSGTVKWFLPLSFGFKVEDDNLIILSSIWKYRLLAPFRATAKISLVRSAGFDISQKQLDKDLSVIVSVNGRTVTVCQKTVVQIYSKSALQAAVIPYILWPLL